MSDLGPYARLYLSLVDDPKFEAIYDDDHHWAAWCRLLMIAEPAWPASAHMPRKVRPASVRALVGAGLIDLQPGDRYRIHGLDAERERRQQQARTASNARWNPPSNAASNAPAPAPRMPNRAEPSTTEPSLAPAREGGDDDPAGAYWSLVGKYPTGKVLAWIDDLTARYGGPAVIRSMAQAHMADRAAATLLGRTSDLLAAGARQLERAEREDEARRLREKRAVPPPVMPTWDDAERSALWERHRADIARAAGRPSKNAGNPPAAAGGHGP